MRETRGYPGGPHLVLPRGPISKRKKEPHVGSRAIRCLLFTLLLSVVIFPMGKSYSAENVPLLCNRIE